MASVSEFTCCEGGSRSCTLKRLPASDGESLASAADLSEALDLAVAAFLAGVGLGVDSAAARRVGGRSSAVC